MKKLLIGFVLISLSVQFALAQKSSETEPTKVIKLKTNLQLVISTYGFWGAPTRIYYPYAFFITGDINSKQHKSLLKQLTKDSAMQWDYFEKSGTNGYIIVPAALTEEYNQYYKIAQRDLAAFEIKAQNLPEKFIPSYNNDLGKRYSIEMTQFYDFSEFLIARQVELIPFTFINSRRNYSINLPTHKKISKKYYPYYGKLTIKLKDSQDREIDSYGYIYDKVDEQKPWGEFVHKEFKATVTTTSTKNTYDILCDGTKITSVNYYTESTSTYYDQNGMLSALLAAMGGVLEGSRLSGYEQELYRVAQQDVCFYEGDLERKGKQSSDQLYREASEALAKGNYYEAMKKIDASLWAHENANGYELRAIIFNRFGFYTDAIANYLIASKLAKAESNTGKLASIYRNIAIALASLKSPVEYRTLTGAIAIISPELALTYLQKAASQGDRTSKILLEKNFDSRELLKRILQLD